MRRIAVFGNAGGGKSTLARRLAEITRLPLHVVDYIKYPNGGAVPDEEYLRLHARLIAEDAWIIDGYGSVATAWQRFERADTLVHVDLPLALHYWRVTKRLVTGLFVPPKGWPPGSPLWASTLSSYRVIPKCHRALTPRYRALVEESATTKRAYRLTSPAAVRSFVAAVEREHPKGRRG